jgi:hypothetical protein
MIRPTLTLFFSALWGWAYLGFCTPAEHQDKLMGAIVLMVNGFWFGEKLFNKTNVLELLQRKPKEQPLEVKKWVAEESSLTQFCFARCWQDALAV